MIPDLDEFTRAYIEAALWSSINEAGEPLDNEHGIDSVDFETLDEMERDARDFQKENWDYIKDRLAPAGHDFWLTRNGHGAGFLDGDWPERAASRLAKSAKSYGEYNLYVGEDGMIDGMRG